MCDIRLVMCANSKQESLQLQSPSHHLHQKKGDFNVFQELKTIEDVSPDAGLALGTCLSFSSSSSGV